MAYVTPARVTQRLGSYDSTADLTAAMVTDYIADADAFLNRVLGPRFYRFNAIDSVGGALIGGAFTTPQSIEQWSMELALSYCQRHLADHGSYESVVERRAVRVADLEERIGNEAQDVRIPAERVSGDTVTFGSSGDKGFQRGEFSGVLGTSFLDSGDPPNVIETTVNIASGTTVNGAELTLAQLQDMRRGIEWDLKFSPQWSKYIFTAFDTRIVASVTTLKVDYDWDYRRDRGSEPSAETRIASVF